MKMPLFRRDLDDKIITRLAKTLKKAYPGESPIGLAQCQNLIAIILGYEGLNDAQRNMQLDESSISFIEDTSEISQRARLIISEISGTNIPKLEIPFYLLLSFRPKDEFSVHH